MLLTKASEYALLSLIYIAQKDAPSDVDTMSGELDISKSFLAKILQNLARAKLLNSYKGAKGGFVLARDADEITLSEIIKSAERRKATVFDCTAEGIDACPNGRTLCRVNLMFGELQEKVDEYMDTITLADIIGKERK